jgi:hypothetical protein
MLPTIVIVSFAEITRVGAAVSAVAYVQPATAMPAPEKPHQKALPGADRGHRFVALPVHRITPDHSLIVLVSNPVNITHMMIRDKDPAVFGSTRGALTLLSLPSTSACRRRRP